MAYYVPQPRRKDGDIIPSFAQMFPNAHGGSSQDPDPQLEVYVGGKTVRMTKEQHADFMAKKRAEEAEERALRRAHLRGAPLAIAKALFPLAACWLFIWFKAEVDRVTFSLSAVVVAAIVIGLMAGWGLAFHSRLPKRETGGSTEVDL